MQEKVSLTVFNESSVQEAVEILKRIGFPPVGEPVAVSGGNDSHRTIAFMIHPSERTTSIESEVANVLGVVRCASSDVQGLIRLNVTYNCEIVKGREISDTVERIDPLFKVVNDRIDSFSKVSSKIEKTRGVVGLIVLSLYLLIVNMLLPSLPFTRGIYEYLHMFP